MSITFNIYGSSTDEPETAVPMVSGASVEVASSQAPDVMHALLAMDAGPPSAALVQEVEAALLMTRDGAVMQQSGTDAGAAPV
jgi:hypothetical protein